MSDVTELLVELSRGSDSALERLIPLLYDELRSLADRKLRQERPGHTLQPTALVHECYLKLIDQERVEWQSRAHFLAVSAGLIRRILIDHARRRRALRRGGEGRREDLSPDMQATEESDVDLLALDEALEKLAAFDSRKSKLVELRFFGGLTIEETASMLEISHATVEREWNLARAWLYREVRRGDDG